MVLLRLAQFINVYNLSIFFKSKSASYLSEVDHLYTVVKDAQREHFRSIIITCSCLKKIMFLFGLFKGQLILLFTLLIP